MWNWGEVIVTIELEKKRKIQPHFSISGLNTQHPLLCVRSLYGFEFLQTIHCNILYLQNHFSPF